jgi:S1-C subfamily serine protease
MAVLEEVTQAVGSAAERVGPSVVGLGRGWGRGSGVVVAAGSVLTTAHNLRGEQVTVVFADGRRETGAVAGVDADGDVAVVSVETGDVEPVEWGDPDGLGFGSVVFALANPGGRGLRATLGLVSSVGSRLRGARGRRIRGTIEHTAPLPRGSSGGPLVDASGRLLGLNAVRMDGGLIVAIPADAALRERVAGLARGEVPVRPRLGIAIAPAHVARRLRSAVGLPERDGLLVRWVEDGGAADRAGIEKGDLIVAVDGEPVARVDDLQARLEGSAAGSAASGGAAPSGAATAAITLTVVRGSEEREVAVGLEPVEA